MLRSFGFTPGGLKLVKIAILGTRGIPARYGGFETFAEQLSTRLVERGYDVTVFCEESDQQLQHHSGVRLQYVQTPLVGKLTTILFDARCLWQARKDFDIVYMLGYGASPFCIIPRLWGKQVWVNMDGLEWARAKWSKMAKAYFRLTEAIATVTANGLIADAEGIRHYLVNAYPNLNRCEVIPYGAPVLQKAPRQELLQPFEVSADDYYLVVCRLEPENHVKEIVEGYLASHSTKPLLVVGNHEGDGEYVSSLRALSDPRLRFVGPVYDVDTLQALRFYCHSYFHGHSVGGTNPTLLEAMGCSNAVVAHDNIFNREVLRHSGRFFRSGNEFAGIIDSLERDEHRRMWMKSEAARIVAEFYTWDGITDRYCELFERIMAPKKQRRVSVYVPSPLPEPSMSATEAQTEVSIVE
jgi:glycosyltransferase involved in cell wall biosynthesis